MSKFTKGLIKSTSLTLLHRFESSDGLKFAHVHENGLECHKNFRNP